MTDKVLKDALMRIAFDEDTIKASGNPTSWPSTIAYLALGGRYEDGEALDSRESLMARSYPSFQERIQQWIEACFGGDQKSDKAKAERSHRFLEEALELVQACGCSSDDAHQLVNYVFNRPAGDKYQEVGGVKVTLAALCTAQDIDMQRAGETELLRVWENIETIREKQASKPQGSPLPQPTPEIEPTYLICEIIKPNYMNFTHVASLIEDSAQSIYHKLSLSATQYSVKLRPVRILRRNRLEAWAEANRAFLLVDGPYSINQDSGEYP